MGYSVAVVLWSLAGMAHAAARSVFSFGVARFFPGIGRIGQFPGGCKKQLPNGFLKKSAHLQRDCLTQDLISELSQPRLSSLRSPWAYGWEWAFIITGSLGFIWVLFWLLFYKLPNGGTEFLITEGNAIEDGSQGKQPEKTNVVEGYPCL